MAVTVRDLLKVDSVKGFQLLAGEKGLDLPITCVEILDFEFVEEGEEYRKKSFEGNSITLASFVYAKGRPDLVTEAVKKLWAFHVHALAYKPVIFQELPKEALEYADRVGFPIFVFSEDAWFENIAFDIQAMVRKTGQQEIVEPLLERMMTRRFSQVEKDEAIESVNPNFRGYFRAYYVRGNEGDVAQSKMKTLKLPPRLQQSAYVNWFRNGYMMMISGDFPQEIEFEETRDQIFALLGLEEKKVHYGISEIRRTGTEFDACILEAYWAEIFGEIEGVGVKNFRDLKADRLFIPWPEATMTGDFSADYLEPLFVPGEDKNEELLSTAIAYVLTNGDLSAAAERMFCHKNTIRYRVGKLQEKLDPNTTEKEFFQNLSAAVKIYLLMREK